MDSIKDIPYTTAEFDKDGSCIRQPAVPDDTREVIVVSHGWKNNRAEAEAMYAALFTRFAALHPGNPDGFAIVGVIWPSKQFDFAQQGKNRQDGVAAASADAGTGVESENRVIAQAFDEFERVFADSGKQEQVAALRTLSTQLHQPDAQARFVEQLKALVATPETPSELDGSDAFFGAHDPRGVFKRAEQASAEVDDAGFDGGDDDGAAAGLGDVFSGVANAVGSLLNITTYYEMKTRAGTVGKGLADVIDALAGRERMRRIHLVGHSFGARLVTAAAMASSTPKLHSMSLLQAAFSHNGFSELKSGYFRQVIAGKRLAGPIIITHTANDKAVGKAYAIASRLSGDAAAGTGDADDLFGGLGRNGAVNMGAAEVSRSIKHMLAPGQAYQLQNGLIHNLESSPFIKDHGDVEGEAVAWAISKAIATPAAAS